MVRVLAVADTDSYLKWGAATLARLPIGWSERRLVVLRNAVMPSPAQVAAAGTGGATGPVQVLGLPALVALLRRERPDVVLLACTGPVLATLARLPALRGRGRPVLVTGLPGISWPASPRAVLLRRSCDLFLVHSHRERAAFTALGGERAPGLAFGLARLPFLPDPAPAASPGPAAPPDPAAPTGPGADLVFAPQAQVPADWTDREAVLRGLAAAPPVLVKLRAGSGEQQTHRETHPYDQLWAGLVARGEVPADAVRFGTGAMADALAGARGLVTVSSTAALEAVAAGLPVLVVDDFGISAELINLVFAGSGCTGPLAALAAGDLRRPDPAWLTANYLHPAEDEDAVDLLTALVDRRARAGLPVPAAPAPVRLVRQSLRLALTGRQLHRLGEWTARPRALGRRARARLRPRRDG